MLAFLLAGLSKLLLQIACATIIEVPGDHSNITLALEATNPNDTVLVHPGTYQERLIFPGRDLVLISDYFMT